jgi:hypothetical protein
MNGTMIASTKRGTMNPLAYQGIFATDCHHQIVSVLRSRLGDAHVLLFAEPAFDPGRDIVDWYSPVQGTPVRLVDLPSERQDHVRATLVKMAADISTQVQQLKNTGDSSRMVAGHIIELALQYPNDECIYLVGEQPVLVCWGFGPSTSGAKPQDLGRLSTFSPRPKAAARPAAPAQPSSPLAAPSIPGQPPTAPPPSSPPTPPEASRSGSGRWVRWLLLLVGLLLLALAFLPGTGALLSTLRPLGLDPMIWRGIGLCAIGALLLAALLGAPIWLRWLFSLLGLGLLLWLLWLLLRGGFLPGGPLLSGTDAPRLTQPSAVDAPAATEENPELLKNKQLLEERDALLVALKEKAALCPPAAPSATAQELRLPDDARAGSSLAFLEGLWTCDSDLSTTKDPVTVGYFFDGQGKGQITVKTEQRVCVAEANASLGDSGRLLIETAREIPCSKGGPIDGQRVECVNTGDSTACEGVNITTKGVWKAKFLKF